MRIECFRYGTWVVDIFSISNGCWSSLHDINILQQYHGVLCPPVLNSNSSILNWDCDNFILSFDIVDEKFREIPMPNCLCQEGNVHSLLTACHVKACLCCYSYRCNEDINIWVLTCLNAGDKSRVGNDPVYSWVKQVSIRFPDQKIVYPMSCWMNDNELLLNVKYAENLTEVCSYDLRTQQLKGTGHRRRITFRAHSYTESLVSIKSLMQHTTYSDITYNKFTPIEQDGRENLTCFTELL
ncbi:F-box/LRR-repeat/kelch-repeat protein At2g27520-like [Beta vulgaris subsp. vulgaris]|uniref:F-box/LRR-repeat/kelch-repeat protein At2g27520-like n=1 Tax=Beta vulgaris subsp. vulgaris TaxID=3555 RepID=UPI00254833EA|nr:F-box/LRR-repeat/kelch-repeat protein At2g27520-like [Beta vulgaris subsp. vulgaris]